VDGSGSAFVTGTRIRAICRCIAAAQSASGGDYDAFVAKVSPAGDALPYLSYLGGTGATRRPGLRWTHRERVCSGVGRSPAIFRW